MKLTRGAALLLLPALTVFVILLARPLINVLDESFREYVPGRVGSAEHAPLTVANYRELGTPAYLNYFLDTFRISLIATVIALVVAYPIAYHVARLRVPGLRKLWIGFLIAMMFLSVLVRVYSLALTFGPVGFLGAMTGALGVDMASTAVTEGLVVAGLLHYLIPISALTLIGTIQNVNPKLAEAAQTLGAPRVVAHVTVTIPLSARGLLSAFLIGYTLSISAFVIPMILGRGRVLFVSNLIYSRFSEVANYPSGAAISMVMLALSLVIIYVVSRAAIARWDAR
jgi:ABC-type spermidine/putrescine transport system permease subunit I